MPKVTLIYFGNCPNIDCARTAIREAGILAFTEVNQDHLPPEHPYLNYSSPTILVDSKVVMGMENSGSACSLANWNSISKKISESFGQA